MFRNFLGFFAVCLGWRLFCFILALVLIIITFYQLLITLFLPCFGNVLILIFEYCALITVSFWTIFGY